MPTRPHILETLSCKEPQPPLQLLHLQTQNQSLSKLVMVKLHNKEQEREAASVIHKNDWNDE